MCLFMDVPWTSQLLFHPRILGYGVVVGVSVHRCSMDVPVTVPSMDTNTLSLKFYLQTCMDDIGKSMALLAMSDILHVTSSLWIVYLAT